MTGRSSLDSSCRTSRRQVYVHLVSECTSSRMKKNFEEGKVIRTWRVSSANQLKGEEPGKRKAHAEPGQKEEEEEREHGEEKLFHSLTDWVLRDHLHATVFLVDGRGDFDERENSEVDEGYRRREKEDKEERSKDDMLSSFATSSISSSVSSSFSLLLGNELHSRHHTRYQRDREQEEEGGKRRKEREKAKQEEDDLDEDSKNEKKPESFLEKLLNHLFSQVWQGQEENEEPAEEKGNTKKTVYIGLSIFLLLGPHVADLLSASSSSSLSSASRRRDNLPYLHHSPRCLACLVSYLPSSFSSPSSSFSSSSAAFGKERPTPPVEDREVSGVRTLQVRDLHELREILRVALTRLDSLRLAYQKRERGEEVEDQDNREVSEAFLQDSYEAKEAIDNKAGVHGEKEEDEEMEERKSRRRAGSSKKSESRNLEEIL